MDIKNYNGVNGLRYVFKRHTYALCNVDDEGVTPEEYSKSSDGEWCALLAIDIASTPIEKSIYPSVHLYFDWDEKKETMHPTAIEDSDAMYDIDKEMIVHRD